MKPAPVPSLRSKPGVLAAAVAAVGLLAGPLPAGANDSLVTAVFSSTHNGYHRQKLPDGTFRPETYVVGNAGAAGGTNPNPRDDDVPFPALVRLLAPHLASQQYYPAKDAEHADLLLVLTWGETIPFNDSPQQTVNNQFYTSINNMNAAKGLGLGVGSVDGIQSWQQAVQDAARDQLEGDLIQMQMFNDMRRKADERNARLLGYAAEINGRDNGSRFAGAGTYFDDLNSDIENPRYYVIISAYDYPTAIATKKRKLLWATRVSIQSDGNRFRDSVATMLAQAGRQLGHNSGQLFRDYQRERVHLGDIRYLGVVPEPEPTTAPEPAPAPTTGGKPD